METNQNVRKSQDLLTLLRDEESSLKRKGLMDKLVKIVPLHCMCESSSIQGCRLMCHVYPL